MEIVRLLRRLFYYSAPDQTDYWSGRSSEPGLLAVMWHNPSYNEAVDYDQWKVIERNLPLRTESVLDLGCGIGRMTLRLASIFSGYTGVDIEAMINEAKHRHPLFADSFIARSVQEYDYPDKAFDMVLSLGCLAAACRREDLLNTVRCIVSTTRPGGKIVLIEPFHRLSMLVRNCRVNTKEVINMFVGQGTVLEEWSGVHFIPIRLLLTRATFCDARNTIFALYRIGELIVRLAPRHLGDYSVIVLRKK